MSTVQLLGAVAICLLAIKSFKTPNPFILKIVEIYKALLLLVNMSFSHEFLVLDYDIYGFIFLMFFLFVHIIFFYVNVL
jgi:hypothetical protein